MALKYHKQYTRDNGLIIQASWSYAFVDGFELMSGKKNPLSPSNIYYVNEGATEIWDCDESFQWFMDALLEENKTSKALFKRAVEEYMLILKELGAYKKKGVLSSVKKLKEFIDFLFCGSRHFVIFYYSAYDERTPQDIRREALRIRDVDAFYDDCEKIIKKTISTLWPHTKGRELVIKPDDLDSIPNADILDQRMVHSVFIPGQIYEITTLEKFAKKNKEFEFQFDQAPETIMKNGLLKGQIANKGHAEGRVRILRRKAQVSELKEGEVLVSPMTTPDFVPAMEKAAAIVTDEGGITCHAAIVSRELDKPCITGTRFATDVLKDGDLVEVDANKGIVRRIE